MQWCVWSWYKSGVVTFVSLKSSREYFSYWFVGCFFFFVFTQRTVFSGLCYGMVEIEWFTLTSRSKHGDGTVVLKTVQSTL